MFQVKRPVENDIDLNQNRHQSDARLGDGRRRFYFRKARYFRDLLIAAADSGHNLRTSRFSGSLLSGGRYKSEAENIQQWNLAKTLGNFIYYT